MSAKLGSEDYSSYLKRDINVAFLGKLLDRSWRRWHSAMSSLSAELVLEYLELVCVDGAVW